MPQRSVCEIVQIYWKQPIGARYYSSAAYTELPNFSNLRAKLGGASVEARLPARSLTEIELSADIADSPIQLDFYDADFKISNLFGLFGEGTRVEIYHYFADTDTLTGIWWGQLETPDSLDYETLSLKASEGFVSSQIACPRRVGEETCAAIFGGELATQAEIDENDCPYNRHIGGSVGNLDENGQPYTRCPKTPAADVERLGRPSPDDAVSYYYMGFIGGTVTYTTPYQPGGSVVAKGNESRMKNVIWVVLGAKYVRDLDFLFYALEPIGTVISQDRKLSAYFRVCEGEVALIEDLHINETAVPPNAIQVRREYAENRR